METNETLARRIAELETRLEFQDETIARLNDELVVHQKRYQDMRKQLELLIDRLKEKAPDFLDSRDEPPPPHY